MATTQENIDSIHQMVMDDRLLTVNYIANIMSFSHEQVENIIHKELGMSKVSAQWMPQLLIPDQKLTRLVKSEAKLTTLEQIQMVLLSVFSPNISVGSITSNQKQNSNPCSGST